MPGGCNATSTSLQRWSQDEELMELYRAELIKHLDLDESVLMDFHPLTVRFST